MYRMRNKSSSKNRCAFLSQGRRSRIRHSLLLFTEDSLRFEAAGRNQRQVKRHRNVTHALGNKATAPEKAILGLQVPLVRMLLGSGSLCATKQINNAVNNGQCGACALVCRAQQGP